MTPDQPSSPANTPAEPAVPSDPRFDFGLLYDVAKVLDEHGYPPITVGRDLTELQMHSMPESLCGLRRPDDPLQDSVRRQLLRSDRYERRGQLGRDAVESSGPQLDVQPTC